STNYECGTLVHGFDSSPFVMMTYNPDWYDALLQGAGLTKAKDLLAYTCHPKRAQNTKVGRVAERSAKAHGLTIRPINLKRFPQEVDAIWKIYNAAWSGNWGYAPMTEEEFRFIAKEMKQILVPDFALIGEVRGRPVGFALALPDINQALKPAGGNLFPFGLIKILYHQRRIRNLRVLALGVVEEYRTTGVAACFYSALIRDSLRLGWEECEFSWILEDNILMNRSIEAIGGQHYKTYRIYEGMIHHA
ncbi:MAG: N-acetyltransferase, partial [Acidobacteria bacterium]|nr:N-acetyltransferase [Acidobacteriota bacterium]